MAAKQIMGQFVADALLAGKSRKDIKDALAEAGWSDREVSDALSEYSEVEFMPPVPRPRPRLTAQDVFIYAVLFTALTFTATNLINLVHAILDIRMPDTSDNEYLLPLTTSKLRWSVAALVVSAPVYFWMSFYTYRRIEKDQGHRRSLVRIWLTYLTLFVAGLVFLGDATVVIYQFLQGEATLRFLLKAVTVAVVSLAIFVFYLREMEYLTSET